jgi:hypothetical protein
MSKRKVFNKGGMVEVKKCDPVRNADFFISEFMHREFKKLIPGVSFSKSPAPSYRTFVSIKGEYQIFYSEV